MVSWAQGGRGTPMAEADGLTAADDALIGAAMHDAGGVLGGALYQVAAPLTAERERARAIAARLEAQCAVLEAALRGLVEAWDVKVGPSTWAQDDAAREAAGAALAMLDSTT